jgi:hypothetical protein
MVRYRTLIIAVAVLAASGCTALQKTPVDTAYQSLKTHVQKATGQQPAAPQAVEFTCAWQNRLQQLPDPGRGGQMTPGVVGQVFLYGRAAAEGLSDFVPAEVTGDLVVAVSDATPRPAGAPVMNNEVWHFTNDKLRQMVMTDERFGKCLILFLPWPAHWKDVSVLNIQARYDQPGGNTLYAQPMTLTIDTQNQFSSKVNGGMTTGNFLPVPDPRMVLQKMTTPPSGNALQQASIFAPPAPQPFDTRSGAFAPPPPSIPPQGLYAPPTGAPMTPANGQDFKTTIRR